jgi:hypothetical protein
MIHLTDTFISLVKWLLYAVRLVLVFNFVGFAAVTWSKRRHLIGPKNTLTPLFTPWREMFYMALSILLFILSEWMETFIPGVSRPLARVLFGTFWVVVLSSGLFTLKVRALRYYAILEGGFAITVCVSSLLSMKDDIQIGQALALLTSAYLVIRAADNFRKDLEERNAKKASLSKEVNKLLNDLRPSAESASRPVPE